MKFSIYITDINLQKILFKIYKTIIYVRFNKSFIDLLNNSIEI